MKEVASNGIPHKDQAVRNLATVWSRSYFGDNVVQQITSRISVAYVRDIYFSCSQACGLAEMQLVSLPPGPRHCQWANCGGWSPEQRKAGAPSHLPDLSHRSYCLSPLWEPCTLGFDPSVQLHMAHTGWLQITDPLTACFLCVILGLALSGAWSSRGDGGTTGSQFKSCKCI